jgi:hypothetical protein
MTWERREFQTQRERDTMHKQIYTIRPAPGQPGSLHQTLASVGIYLSLRRLGMDRRQAWDLARRLSVPGWRAAA